MLECENIWGNLCEYFVILLVHSTTEMIQAVNWSSLHPDDCPALLIKKGIWDMEDLLSGAVAASSPVVVQDVRGGVVLLAGKADPSSSRIHWSNRGGDDH